MDNCRQVEAGDASLLSKPTNEPLPIRRIAMQTRRVVTVSLLAAVSALLYGGAAHAIPAFARREGVGCQMCHFRMPELNQDGHEYAMRGLREENEFTLATRPSLSAAKPRPLGQPLEIVWAEYLTLMGHHMFIAQENQESQFDAGEMDIWAAGPINPHWTGVLNPSFDIEEGGADVAEGYGMYITRWSDRSGSVRFGQLLPFAMLFNQAGPSMALTEPVVLSQPAPSGSTWAPDSLLRGAEVGAVNLPRWNAYFGVGQPYLPDAPDNVEPNTDVYASTQWLIGDKGDGLTGYGYWGHASLGLPAADDLSFHRLGLFGTYYNPKQTLKLNAGYMTGEDSIVDASLDSDGYYLLAEYLLSDRWAIYGRYDHLEQDQPGGGSETSKGPALGVSWWAATQVRVTVEGQLLDAGDEDQNQLLMEFMWIF